ncbi:HNH endonuclease [Actinoplanes sp. TBRC 11911]|uniref:HNH endonuclease n=1 Tax=Actinoplanes sp. TBRC 11911 TaxID=2729386 RepID=UPI00145F8919|nr:HNH endonuclease signature motif containing protein [Actinoplanes sp. TBRC 11911]NMO53442.1 HNH endonuclease [Actinoplanes sp. TBRC 11911]
MNPLFRQERGLRNDGTGRPDADRWLPVSGRPPAAGPLLADQVGYRGSDDVLLRGALYEVWGAICVGCGRAKVFTETQIEHLIPRTVDPSVLDELIIYHGLDTDFHVDQPANLTVICGPCNNKKRDRILRTPGMTTLLHIARDHSPHVIRLVREHATARQVARGLTTAVRADMRDAKTRAEFMQHAPAVVQTLALLDEKKADFVVHRDIRLSLCGDIVSASLTLDAYGRAVSTWVEEFCGRPWREVLEDGVRELITYVADRADWAARNEFDETGNLASISTDALFTPMRISGCHRDGTRMTVEISGQMHGYYTAVVNDIDPWGPDPEIIDIGVDVHVIAQYTMTMSWDLTAAPVMRVKTDVWIPGTAVDVETSRA